jgi:uncharacterized protein (DUF433 family)
MLATKNKPHLGEGIYTASDIASILGLPPAKVRHWLNDYWDARFSVHHVGRYSWGSRLEKAVNFHTLIEFYTFYQLRLHGISSQKIIKAHEIASKVLNTPYPFATSKILTDKKVIFFEDKIADVLSADDNLQYELKEVIEPFCHKIDFNGYTLAQRFFPLGRQVSIVVDPHYQFGQPVITGTNIQAQMLYLMNKSGDSPDFLASLYDIELKQVNDAIKFCRKAA